MKIEYKNYYTMLVSKVIMDYYVLKKNYTPSEFKKINKSWNLQYSIYPGFIELRSNLKLVKKLFMKRNFKMYLTHDHKQYSLREINEN